MKFSVLLPTRNRLEYLRYAIETVRRQDYSLWEVIVSDNFSEEDLYEYIQSLDEPRIRYIRTQAFIPVTDNWNNALSYCTGDYIVMLGDDDGLMPGYFSRLMTIFDKFSDPDYVYLGGYFFAYSGAISGNTSGFLRRDSNALMRQDIPYWIDAAHAHSVTTDYLNFRMPIASNMQFSLISKRMVTELSQDGPFFRSPYPDFYATPLLFLRSKTILICPMPFVFVGISKKSYGAFHFDGRTAAGTDFLGNTAQLDAVYCQDTSMLPGTKYYDSWLMAMRELERVCQRLPSIKPNLARYRFLQMLHIYKGYYGDEKFTSEDMERLHKRLNFFERVMIGPLLMIAVTMIRCVPAAWRTWLISRLRSLLGQHQIVNAGMTFSSSATLLDAFEYFVPPDSLES